MRFNTEAFWRLPPEQREGPRLDYLAAQGRRAQRLRSSCLRLGTLDGQRIARQYALWAEWTRTVEMDPVATDHVLTLWAKAHTKARRARGSNPRTVDEVRTWLKGQQNDITGSWAPAEAPLWLAIGETAEALQLVAPGDSIPDDLYPMVFLSIVHTPEAAWEVMLGTLEEASAVGFQWPVRCASWLPWLRWRTRGALVWDGRWDGEFRRCCDRYLLHKASGGYVCVAGEEMDIASTYRLALGWSAGSSILCRIPSPHAMAATIIARADSMGEQVRSSAAALLVGSIADIDSCAAARACGLLRIWADSAAAALEAGDASRTTMAAELLDQVGAWEDARRTWLMQAGCTLEGYPSMHETASVLDATVRVSVPDIWTLRAHCLAIRLAGTAG